LEEGHALLLSSYLSLPLPRSYHNRFNSSGGGGAGRSGPKMSKKHEPLPEMKFFIGIFSRGFWAETRVFSVSSFCLVSFSHFSFLQNAIHE
jgi:hypothetical protein